MVALEELDPQQRLQLGYLGRQRRLTHKARLGGLAKAQTFGEGYEVLELAQCGTFHWRDSKARCPRGVNFRGGLVSMRAPRAWRPRTIGFYSPERRTFEPEQRFIGNRRIDGCTCSGESRPGPARPTASKVKPIELHDFAPGEGEVVDKLLLRIVGSIDLN